MKYKWVYFAISLIIMIPGLVSLAMFGLKPSIDFTGGTLLEISSEQPINVEDLKNLAQKNELELSTIQESTDNTYLLKFKHIDKDQNEKFKTEIASMSGKLEEKRFETVGPVVGAELTQRALLAVAVATIAVVIYIAWSFRTIPKPYSSWKFGGSTIVALVHDILVVIGLFSLLGHFFQVEVDALFVTAMLTVIGFSVHDTIVVFDRIRENLPKMGKVSFEEVADFSIGETLVRSLNTSVTIMLTLVALLLFGGESIRWFVVALLAGIVSGTYSSIFNATPLLVVWEKGRKSNALHKSK